MDTGNGNFSPKSFWEKPEGTTGMIFLVAIIGGLGIAAYLLLPFIITLLANTLTAILLFAVIAFIVFLVTNKRIRTLVSYMYKSIMRKITSVFITIDPIGILKSYVSELEENADDMEGQIANLRGQMRNLQEVIDRNENEKQSALKLAKKAQEMANKQVLTLKSRAAGRLTESNVTLQTLYNKMEMLYRVLSKMRETCLVLIEDLKGEVDVKEREYKVINASYSALKSAMKIVNGDPDQKQIFEQTMEYLADNYGQKLGEIEEFISMSAGFISSVDVQNGVYEEEALKMLEKWEKKSDSLLLGDDDKQTLILQAHNPDDVLDLSIPLSARKGDPLPAGKSDADNGKYNRFFR